MKKNYETCLPLLLAHEGGYTNDTRDPGGPTNFGITIFDYRKYVKPNATAADIRAMSIDDAKNIYRVRYWDAQRCDDLPGGVDYAIFDYGVNSGVSRAGKVLRRVIGLPEARSGIDVDVITTVRAMDAKSVITAVCAERLKFLQSLRTWKTFGTGWARRVADVRRTALSLAVESEPSPDEWV